MQFPVGVPSRSDVTIERLQSGNELGKKAYLEFRRVLYAGIAEDENRAEVDDILSGDRVIALLARTGGEYIGFAEAGTRDYAEGALTNPVAYLEGWFVAPAWRQRAVGRALVEAAENWARSRGCSEFASDALLDNEVSIYAHRRLGFQEVERIVCFLKKI